MFWFNIYIACLLIASSQISIGQALNLKILKEHSKSNSFELKTKSKPLLIFGFETAFNATFEKKIKQSQSIYAFLDLNLHQETYFLKNEIGSIVNYDENENLSFYGSLGLSINVARPNKHNLFYFHSAIFTVINKTGGGFSFFLSMRYLHKFSNALGLVTSFRYPMGRFDAVSVSIGIQFY